MIHGIEVFSNSDIICYGAVVAFVGLVLTGAYFHHKMTGNKLFRSNTVAFVVGWLGFSFMFSSLFGSCTLLVLRYFGVV